MKIFWWLISFLWIGCNQQPEAIRYGQDACAFCRMVIADEKFGSELITQKGKIYKFDSIECLAAYRHSDQISGSDIHSMWITNFKTPGQWLPAEQTQFLQSPNVPSPMGMSLSGYASSDEAKSMQSQFGGEVLNWEQVVTRVEMRHAQP